MITIYHNARCSKSREGLEVLKQSGEEYQIREYLKEPFTEDELKGLLNKLRMAPMELVRTDEKIWKENYKNKDLNDLELIRVMIKNPQLIQRPIVSTKNQAVVGRPATKIEDLVSGK